MIKLKREPIPPYLTNAKVIELTNKFKNEGTNVWNNDLIKVPLLTSSNKKCAYCECSLTIASNYMEVEHFEDKDNNSNKVILWSNLLPSCKKCNGAKGTHDVITDPIIEPYNTNPQDHLYLKGFRLKKKTILGQNSINVCGLNNSSRLVQVRFDIGEKVEESITISLDRYQAYLEKPITGRLNKLKSIIEELLLLCQPNATYSATTSTILNSDIDFNDLLNTIKLDNKIWNDELEELHQVSLSIKLDRI